MGGECSSGCRSGDGDILICERGDSAAGGGQQDHGKEHSGGKFHGQTSVGNMWEYMPRKGGRMNKKRRMCGVAERTAREDVPYKNCSLKYYKMVNKLCLYSSGNIWVFHGFAHFPQSFQQEMFWAVYISMNIFMMNCLYEKLICLCREGH